MDVILHIGAHRTGSTTFQAYMRQNTDVLAKSEIAFWGPRRTRNGLFSGLIPEQAKAKPAKKAQDRAEGRVQLRLAQAEQSGKTALILSDENMLGSVRGNIRDMALYPQTAERLAHFARAFDGKITRIAMSIRAQDRYWSSAIAYGVMRGHPIPGRDKLRSIASSQRSWRDVITDLSEALPGVEINVMPYESFYANPRALLSQAGKLDVPLKGDYEWLNRAPDLPTLRQTLKDRGQSVTKLPDGEGMWEMFSDEQRASMREKYNDDLFWLLQGADGHATLTEEAMPRDRGLARHAAEVRGHLDDEEGRLDETG
ncbi:hypothetical protein E4Z66_11995 [Aliishimia ponticola]|uniref:Sulfotransferase n=1 Tax=Aliishimia ponticola TaxID=2499833 RepID=A0A4S4NCL3_9RHOB|nr:hypothetical protein [Aliishimia ponticola]THH35798.1 hypothetical protein E4Z66_11995 [Aliishimia ponticola]